MGDERQAILRHAKLALADLQRPVFHPWLLDPGTLTGTGLVSHAFFPLFAHRFLDWGGPPFSLFSIDGAVIVVVVGVVVVEVAVAVVVRSTL